MVLQKPHVYNPNHIYSITYATELNLKMAVFLKFNWAYGASKNNKHYQLHWSTSVFETDRYDSIDMSILYSVFIPSLQVALLYCQSYGQSIMAKHPNLTTKVSMRFPSTAMSFLENDTSHSICWYTELPRKWRQNQKPAAPNLIQSPNRLLNQKPCFRRSWPIKRLSWCTECSSSPLLSSVSFYWFCSYCWRKS